MKRIMLISIIFPLLINGQNSENVEIPIIAIKEKTPHHNITLTSYFSTESDDLSNDFINTMLFGGFISDEMKDNWINNGDDINRLNIELTNRFEYCHLTNQLNSYYFQFSDVNLINSSFNDDLLKLAFHGNYDYQEETLDFSNTVIRADRYQQYKFGYIYNIQKQNNLWQINTALSYLNGNHHAQINIKEAILHTSELATSLDLNYDINSMMTDTSNLSLFTGNGKGLAMDLSIYLNTGTNDYGIKIRDLGYINWNENSIITNTDSSFTFIGVEVEDFNNLPEFNDSIMDISFNSNKANFRSFIPSRITLFYNKNLDHKYFKNLMISSHSRWQPYEIKGGVNWDLYNRGFSESGYIASWDISTNIDLTYLYATLGFSVGGFTDETKIHFALSDKKRFFTIGTYHLNELLLFEEDRTSMSGYIILSTRF